MQAQTIVEFASAPSEGLLPGTRELDFTDLAKDSQTPTDLEVHLALKRAVASKSLDVDAAVSCIEQMRFAHQAFSGSKELAQAAAVEFMRSGNQQQALDFLRVQVALDARAEEASFHSAQSSRRFTAATASD